MSSPLILILLPHVCLSNTFGTHVSYVTCNAAFFTVFHASLVDEASKLIDLTG